MKKYTLLLLLLFCILLTSCAQKTNSYTGKTYSSGKAIISEAVTRIENKYEMLSGEISLVDYTFQGSGGPLGSPSAITPVYITLKDSEGKKFHAYYNAGTKTPMVYDDYQYEDVLADFKEMYKEYTDDCEKVSIKYSSQGMYSNLLSEKEFYHGDLSMISIEKIRMEYIDADLFDYEFPDYPYLLISYESKEDFNDWANDSCWNIPEDSACGIQAMRTEDNYIEYYGKRYGDYYIVGTTSITIKTYSEVFDITQLIGHGAREPEAVSEAIQVITDGSYTVYYRAEETLHKLEEYGFNAKEPLEDNLNIPVYLGHVYDYKDHEDYNTSNCRYINGYFCATDVNSKYKAIMFCLDQANVF